MTLEELDSKALYSMVADDDEITEKYKGINIITDKRGFNSKEEIDNYIVLVVKSLKQE